MHQSNGAVHPLAQGVFTPPCLSFITLITYQLYLTLALSCPWLASAYRSLHFTLYWCWLINIRDSVFDFIRFVLRTNHFLSVSSRQTKFWFWDFPPPGLVSHFLVSFTFPFLSQPSAFCLSHWLACARLPYHWPTLTHCVDKSTPVKGKV